MIIAVQIQTGRASWRGLRIPPASFVEMCEHIWPVLYGLPYATMD